MAEDYYSTLGIRPDASREEIETAYRITLEKISSDQALNKQQLQKKIARLYEAYAVLSDEEKRRQYDQLGGEGFSKRYSLEDIIRGVSPEKILKRLGLENSPLKSLFHNHSSADKPFSFSDLFTKSFDPDFSPDTEPISHPNGDSEIDLVLTLEEAVFGGKKRVILRWGTAISGFEPFGALKDCDSCAVCQCTWILNRVQDDALAGMRLQFMPWLFAKTPSFRP